MDCCTFWTLWYIHETASQKLLMSRYILRFLGFVRYPCSLVQSHVVDFVDDNGIAAAFPSDVHFLELVSQDVSSESAHCSVHYVALQ